VRRNTHKAVADGGEVFDATIEVFRSRSHPGKPIGTHVFTAMGATMRLALDRGHDRQRDDARDALDASTIPQEVLDRIDQPHCRILDHRLGRAAERRDQLSHRVRPVLNNSPRVAS